jgi:predicted nucleotidyltransferase
VEPLEPLIATIRRVLASGPPLRLAVLFGSVARGRSRPSSDLDLAIWPVDSALSLAAELDLQSALETALARSVDLVRLDSASTLVRWEVARDGLAVHQAAPHEWPRFRARAASEYGDVRPALEEAARRYRLRLASESR